jgi:hypothetical protein
MIQEYVDAVTTFLLPCLICTMDRTYIMATMKSRTELACNIQEMHPLPSKGHLAHISLAIWELELYK